MNMYIPVASDVFVWPIVGLQFTDEHGEVCPANWNPGSATMKPDPVKSLDYFSKQ